MLEYSEDIRGITIALPILSVYTIRPPGETIVNRHVTIIRLGQFTLFPQCSGCHPCWPRFPKRDTGAYPTNQNGLNNIGRGPPRGHSCEVWSKSNEWFQRRYCFKKLLTHGRTHRRWTTDNGPSQKLTLSSDELKS